MSLASLLRRFVAPSVDTPRRRINPLGAVIETLESREVPALVNTGFELGNLTGWTTNLTTGNAIVTTSHNTGLTTRTAPYGTQFAVVQAGSANTLQTISQTFDAAAGQELRGSAFFDANDYLPYDDFAIVTINGPEGTTTLFSSSISVVGDYGETPWTEFTYTIPTTGTYTITAGVANALDSGLASFLGFDMAFGSKRFDTKASATAPLPPGWERVLPGTTYNAAKGFGWTSSTGISGGNGIAPTPLPPGTSADMYKDFVLGSGTATFNVFVGVNNSATVTVYTYAPTLVSAGVKVTAENGTTASGSNGIVTVTGNAGADGILKITITKPAGTALWAVNGIDVTYPLQAT